MKEVLAVVRPFRAIEVLREIAKFDVESLRVAEARGYGRQKDQLDRYQGSEFSAVYLPKIEIRFVARDDLVETIVARIIAAARTGRIGDGKIIVSPRSWQRGVLSALRTSCRSCANDAFPSDGCSHRSSFCFVEILSSRASRRNQRRVPPCDFSFPTLL